MQDAEHQFNFKEYREWVLAAIAGVFAITGLADVVVKFDDWIEEGFLIHWQTLKSFLLSYFWISVPSWCVDALVVLGIYSRAVARATRQNTFLVFFVSLLIPCALFVLEQIAPAPPPLAFHYTVLVCALILSIFWALSQGLFRFVLSLGLTTGLGIICVVAFSDALERMGWA